MNENELFKIMEEVADFYGIKIEDAVQESGAFIEKGGERIKLNSLDETELFDTLFTVEEEEEKLELRYEKFFESQKIEIEYLEYSQSKDFRTTNGRAA